MPGTGVMEIAPGDATLKQLDYSNSMLATTTFGSC